MGKSNKAVKTAEVVDAKELAAVEVPKVEIIKGRMPVAVVAMIRFKETERSVSGCATKYRTTVGKIDDIKKGRNFGYVTEDFQPSADQKLAAAEYLGQLEDDIAAQTLEVLEEMGIAEDGGASFEEARKAARKVKKQTAPADTAGEADADDVQEDVQDDVPGEAQDDIDALDELTN